MIMGSQNDVRTRMLEVIQRFNIKQVDVARETGVHHSTLSLWLQNKVKGYKVDDQVEQWLRNFHNNKTKYSTTSQYFKDKYIPPKSNKKCNYNLQAQQTNQNNLVPITIDLQFEGRRIRQVFSWNVNENILSPQRFAKLMAQQKNLSVHHQQQITQMIKRSIQNYKTGPVNSKQWMTTIVLDIRIDNLNLKDKFQWDISNPRNNPQEFAVDLCQEMGLSGQFATKIAHQIREQIQFALKMGQKRNSNAKQQAYVRVDDQGWQPRLQRLQPQQIMKLQKLQQRKNRYYKRFR